MIFDTSRLRRAQVPKWSDKSEIQNFHLEWQWLIFVFTQKFRPPCPNFYRKGIKKLRNLANFGTWGATFQNETTHPKSETHIAIIALSPPPQISLRSLPQLWESGATKLPREKRNGKCVESSSPHNGLATKVYQRLGPTMNNWNATPQILLTTPNF